MKRFQPRKGAASGHRRHTSALHLWCLYCTFHFFKIHLHHGEALERTGKITSLRRIFPAPHFGHTLTSMPVNRRSRSCQSSLPSGRADVWTRSSLFAFKSLVPAEPFEVRRTELPASCFSKPLGRNSGSNPIQTLRPLKNAPFCPTSSSDSNFNPQNIRDIPAVNPA